MNTQTGIDELRRIVENFDDCNEDFNARFTVDQLVTIHRAWMACGWDIYPDCWEERQVREALAGRPPRWDDKERPVYDDGAEVLP